MLVNLERGEDIARLIKRRHWTQRETASRLGVGLRVVQAYLDQSRFMSREVAYRAGKVFRAIPYLDEFGGWKFAKLDNLR